MFEFETITEGKNLVLGFMSFECKCGAYSVLRVGNPNKIGKSNMKIIFNSKMI